MAEITKKYCFTYEESDEGGFGPETLLNKILEDSELPVLKNIVIGYWGECFDEDPQQIIDGIIANKEKFAHIESLFIGDMDYEECEVSWIMQGNYAGLLAALPELKELKIKGSTELVIGEGIKHDKLQSLEIICGGLGLDVIQDIAEADLPALKRMILYLGVDDYGLTAGIDDIKALIDKSHFPALTHLGLVDSEMQDELAAMILDADILPQLEILDLSYGVLTDQGGESLLAGKDKLSGLKKLEINYHYMSDKVVKQLEELPFTVCISDTQDSDSKYQYPILTE